MPGGSWKQVDVKCPFYISDDGSEHITCEGIVKDSNIKLLHSTKSGFDSQMDVYCCNRYESCPVFCMLMEKYVD